MLRFGAKGWLRGTLLAAALCSCSQPKPPENYMTVGPLATYVFTIDRSHQGAVLGTYTLRRAAGHSLYQTTFAVRSDGPWLVLSARGKDCGRYKFSFRGNDLRLVPKKPRLRPLIGWWRFTKVAQTDVAANNGELRDTVSAGGPLVKLSTAASKAFDEWWRGHPTPGCPTDSLSY